MISNPLNTIDNLIKLDWAKYLREKYANNCQRFSTDQNNVSINYNDNRMSKIDAYQSTYVSDHLFLQSKPIFHKNNLTEQVHQSISTSDCVEWANHQSNKSSIVKNMNNNHFYSKSRLNSNLQFSNNKEKKNKKEKSDEKEKKDDTDIDTKKSKKKTIKIEESTDSDSVIQSPSSLTPTQASLNSPKSPLETSGFSSLSIPVPHLHVAHLSQVQQQLQTDLQKPFVNIRTSTHNMSVQQQLQSLSQMARDGDEILITLTINTLTQKQQINNQILSTNPYTSQTWNPMIAPSTNLEIVAKGFARVQQEHSQPPSYLQQSQTLRHPPFTAHCSNSGPPQFPIGPPIQPVFPSPTTEIPDEFNQSSKPADLASSRIRNYSSDCHNCPQRNSTLCDSLCQSSLYQPDFRGRPSPGVTINPFISHSSAPTNFSAKHCSKKRQSYNLNFDDINRTYSSFY